MMYRVQHPTTLHGVWSTIDEDGVPLVCRLDNCPAADRPMPFSMQYGTMGRRWYSAAPSLEVLYQWFSHDNLCQLADMGFQVFEVCASQTFHLTDEVLFTKESVTSWLDVTARVTEPAYHI